MNENLLLTPDKDPMGRAIADYFAHGKAQRLGRWSPSESVLRGAKAVSCAGRSGADG